MFQFRAAMGMSLRSTRWHLSTTTRIYQALSTYAELPNAAQGVIIPEISASTEKPRHAWSLTCATHAAKSNTQALHSYHEALCTGR